MKVLKLVSVMLMIIVVSPKSFSAVSKSERQLLIISNLSKYGKSNYKWLYKFLDASAISMAKNLVGSQYTKAFALTPPAATSKNFFKSLDRITNNSNVDALDVIISLHGNPNRLTFKDGAFNMTSIKNELNTIKENRKFRLLYNTACYGDSHSDEFLAGGFKTSIGSLKVNTASASEYPEFLMRYRMRHPVGKIIKSTNSKMGLRISDAIAKRIGFPNSDSRKVVRGERSLKITSDSI